MSTQFNRQYVYKVFKEGELKDFAIKLMEFCNVDMRKCQIMVVSSADGIECRDYIDIHRLGTITKFGQDCDALNFFVGKEWIHISVFHGTLDCTYILSEGTENAQRISSLAEEHLGLVKVDDQQREKNGSETNITCVC